MNAYVCRRCDNALEWVTREFHPGGFLSCWHCEQRLRNGVPLLPERVETPIEALRAPAWTDDARYQELTQGMAEAKREHRRRQYARDKRDRQRNPAWRAHLDAIRPKAERARKNNPAELWRPYWQRKAEQFELGVA